ncbi:MAG: PDZ domain-containing protein, partial [Elusimicrobiota bacterium]
KLVPTRWSRYGRLVLGDVIVAIDGKKVESNDDLFKLLDEREVGERITLSVERDGRTREVPLTLQELK